MDSKIRFIFTSLYSGLLILSLFFSVNTVWAQLEQPKPTIHMYIFSSKDCEKCEIIEKKNLSILATKTDCVIETKYFDVERMENYTLLVKMEEKRGDTENELPIVFMGKHVLGGTKEIKQKLEKLVRQYAREGGCPWPEKEVSDKQVEATVAGKTVYLAFFYQPGCEECQRIHHLMKYLQSKYLNLSLKKFNLSEKRNKQINEAISEQYNVSDKKRLVVATVFIGEECLQGKEVTGANLEKLINKYSKTGTKCPWDLSENELVQAKQRIISRFKSLGLFTVLTAGLIDGINPCAFATLIFFISYITYVGRKGKEILLIGTSFTFAVFITYLLIGYGVFGVIQRLSNFFLLSQIIRTLTFLLALFLGGLSLYDFFKAKSGKIKEIKLQLPRLLKRHIHLTITRKMKVRNYIIAACVAGFLVSILELACTGQVYLPTIIFVNGQAGMKNQGLFYLVLYNLMFILPLIIIFTLVSFGTTSERLIRFTEKNLATAKLFTSFFFFALAGLLIVT